MRESPDTVSFSTLQVLADLQTAATEGYSALAARLSEGLEPALHRLIFEQGCKMTSRDLADVHGELMMVASMPDQDHASFMTATIVLVSDRLQYGAGEDDLYWNWHAFQERYREATAPVRAALMNGFRCADDLALVALDRSPAGGDLLTYDETDLIRMLRIVARSMTEETRDAVSALASRDIQPVHRKALENCLKSNCALSDFGSWFPREVVEKVSLYPDHPGFAACTALMILDAIETREKADKMVFRYEELAEFYSFVDADIRRPLMAGLRHLHEMHAGWEPYTSWTKQKRVDKAIVMPFPKA